MAETKIKLKLNTAIPAESSNTTKSAHPGIRLNFTPKPSSAVDSTPKSALPAASAGSKKKKRTQTDSDPAAPNSASKKPKAILRINSPATAKKEPARKGSIIRLKKPSLSEQSPTTPGGSLRPALKIKHRGKIPPRPLGAGYDSECSDAEEDPAIEENFILRMAPGADADLIRRAVEEKKIGIPIKDGGADVTLKFFTRDARRACVRVHDRFYGAVLVDLPCIVETLKSWDKRGWWKSADICQMLVVTGRVENEDQARNVEFPKELDSKTMAWPHGLTPPMHDVRRRRFRKRVSHRTIEQAEEEVERLLIADIKARERGGYVNVDNMTWDEFRRQEEGLDEDGEQQDAEGDYDDEMDEDAVDEEAIEDDEEDFMAQFEAQLGEDVPDVAVQPSTTEAAQTKPEDHAVPKKHTGEVSASKVIPEAEVAVESQAEDEGSGSGSGSDEDEDEDGNDDDEEDEEEEEDDEAKEKREQRVQQMEEIAHIEAQIAEKKRQLGATANPLFRQRLLTTIQKFEEDRDVKKRGAGLSLDDEDEDGDE